MWHRPQGCRGRGGWQGGGEGHGFVLTCPGPRLGKLTNPSSKWNVPATQEGIWGFLAPAGWVGGQRESSSVLLGTLPRRVGSTIQA